MPLTRVYLPLTPADLVGLAEGRPLGPAPRSAHAVTAALRKPGLGTDEEALEHAAWLAAAQDASAAREAEGAQAAAGAAPSRRVVAAADVDAALVVSTAAPDVPSRVEVSVPIERRRVVSFHVDEEAGDTEPTDLLWYDVTELADVLALVDRR